MDAHVIRRIPDVIDVQPLTSFGRPGRHMHPAQPARDSKHVIGCGPRRARQIDTDPPRRGGGPGRASEPTPVGSSPLTRRAHNDIVDVR